MISVRFAPGYDIPEYIFDNDGIIVLDNSESLALESEKNQDVHASSVDKVLRPLILDIWKKGPPIFGIVSVETRSGCNYECSFCPVSRSVDPRPVGELRWRDLEKIAGDLQAVDFSGTLALFGNNEPLLDRRIPEIVKLFRGRCPNADIRILSNGTVLKVPLVHALFEAGLSMLTVNNYSDGQRINAPVRLLFRAASELADYNIRVSVRKKDEVLTSRGGTAPNKPLPTARRGFCALPFTDLYITYTGDVALCCFDAYGQVVMGNIRDSSLTDIWNAARFDEYRQQLAQLNRSALKVCNRCDFDGFRDPLPGRGRPLVREDIVGPHGPVAS